MSCAVDISTLPLLTGCPSDNEFFLVGNASGGYGTGGYARRRYADLKNCFAANVVFHKLQFEIGAGGSPLNEGDTTLTITVDNPMANSEFVMLDNNVLIPNLSTQISYTVSYSTTQIVITFNQGVVNAQKYLINYATY